jgi:hypothetical protein
MNDSQKEMRRFTRLLALRDELCPDFVVDWSLENKGNFVLRFSFLQNVWKPDPYGTYDGRIGPYFSKEAAEIACKMLNSGEVEL